MRGVVIISVAFLLSIACGNSNSPQKNDMPKNEFNAWKTVSDTNFLVRWEKAILKSIDSITPILIKEANYSQEMINDLKANIRVGKKEEVVKGRKVYGSHKWLHNKLNGYKELLDTTVCNSMYIVELTVSGEVTESTDWIILSLNDDCRLVLMVDNSGVVCNQNKIVNKQVLEKFIKENYPSALMTNKCLDRGMGFPMADINISKFTENNIEVFTFPTFCSGFHEKFLSIMQE